METTRLERTVGISGYLTQGPGIGGRLKATPEDFVVEEIPTRLPRVPDGSHLLIQVTARNWETNRLVRTLARLLRISRRRIRFAGTKDKRAVSVQRMSIQGIAQEALAQVRLRDVTLEALHRTSRPLALGDLLGNRFRIRLTEIALTADEVHTRLDGIGQELEAAHGFPNFFGLQRFGEVRPVTHAVGRAVVRGDLEEAVRLYLGHPYPEEEADAYEARRTFAESGDVTRALREFPGRLGFEHALLNHLQQHPEDYPGALLALPENLLHLFVNAYQAYLFNQIVSARMARDGLREPWVGDLVLPLGTHGLPRRNAPVPVTAGNVDKVRRQVQAGKAWLSGLIVGTAAPVASGEMGAIEASVLEAEEVHTEDFEIGTLPRLSSRGQRRELVAPLREFAFDVEEGVQLSFRLNPGCYATALLREVTKESSP